MFIIILPLVNCGPPGNPPKHVFTDPQYKFRISCPDSGWILTEETGMTDLLVIVKSEAVIDGFVPNLVIVVEHLPSMTTPKEYGHRNRAALEEQGVEILSEKTNIVNQIEMYDLEYLFKDNGVSLKYRNLCFIRDKIAFVITVTVPEKAYSHYEKELEKIIQSFKFI
ncbi:hypothetical protein JXI42_09380 [bacterium]|nr:hypothetical protein [bacterium]